MSRESIIITGASGLVGSKLAEKLSKKYSKIYCLYHNNPVEVKSQGAKIVPIKVDITRPDIGISNNQTTKMLADATMLVHCAATTDFSVSRKVAEKINVCGTKNILDLARQHGKLLKIGIVSTIYVAGKQTGAIAEEFICSTPGFVNEYERSKFNMEKLIKDKYSDLPVNIFRLSTIIGSSQGIVKQFNSVHQSLRMYHSGLIPIVPASSNCQIDLIDSDFAIDVIANVMKFDLQPMQIYNICAGKKAPTIEHLIQISWQLFNQHDNRWAARGIEQPQVVDAKTYKEFADTVRLINNPVLKNVLLVSNYFFPQLMFPKHFNNTKALEAMNNNHVKSANFDQLYSKIIKYCLETNWGKLANAKQ